MEISARTNSIPKASDQSTVAQRAETTVRYVRYFSSELLTFSQLDEGEGNGKGSMPLFLRIKDSQDTNVDTSTVVNVGAKLMIQITLNTNQGEYYVISCC